MTDRGEPPFSMHDAEFPGKFRKSTYADIAALMHKGYRSMYPIVEKPSAERLEKAGLQPEEAGSFPWAAFGSAGRYRYGIHADGRRVLLRAPYSDGLQTVRHPDPVMSREGVFIINDKSLSSVFVIAARDKHTHEPWIIDGILKYEKDIRDQSVDAGTLGRVDGRTWVSRHIVYLLEDIPQEEYQVQALLGDWDERKRYTLRCYTSDGKGGTPIETGYSGVFQKIFNLGPKPVYATMEDAETIVSSDFSRRVRLVVSGRDPYDYGLPHVSKAVGEGENGVLAHHGGGVLHSYYHDLKRKGLRAVHALEPKIRKIKGKMWAIEAVKGGGLAAMQLLIKGVWGAALSVGAYALNLIDRIVNPYDAISSDKEDKVAKTFWDEDERDGHYDTDRYHHYAHLDPEQGCQIRLISNTEARIRMPHINSAASEIVEFDWAMDYILSTMKGRAGAQAAIYELNGHDVLVINQVEGLRVYHVPDLNLAYAKFSQDLAKPGSGILPRPVADLMKEGKYIKIWESEDGKLNSKAFDGAGFAADIADMTANTPRPDYTIKPIIRMPSPGDAPLGMEDTPYSGILAGAGGMILRDDMNEVASPRRRPVYPVLHSSVGNSYTPR